MTNKNLRTPDSAVIEYPEGDPSPNPVLADAIIDRLNQLCRDPAVRVDVERLLDTRIQVSNATFDHPTIQCTSAQTLGFLGLLNGILGVDEDGNGFIASSHRDFDGELVGFRRFG